MKTLSASLFVLSVLCTCAFVLSGCNSQPAPDPRVAELESRINTLEANLADEKSHEATNYTLLLNYIDAVNDFATNHLALIFDNFDFSAPISEIDSNTGLPIAVSKAPNLNPNTGLPIISASEISLLPMRMDILEGRFSNLVVSLNASRPHAPN